MEVFRKIEDDGDTEIKCEGYDEIVEHIKENGWPECEQPDDEGTILLKKMEKLNDGKHKFAYLDIAYSNETLAEMLFNNKSIQILYSTN